MFEVSKLLSILCGDIVLPPQGTGKWYELQDLHVKEIEPQMLTLTESYIQVRIRKASHHLQDDRLIKVDD